MYEEIGDKDYSPRLPYVSITSKGMVEYKEPCAFHTSCAIDTSFFPFDVQVCHMTYVSWTQPVTHIDLITDREPQQLMKDAKQYFINTGEWQFVRLSARKKMKDYGNLITNDSEDVTVNTR
uniref:5-hydroxytryptamine receptor 3A-like n=1 Tax=Ciona intestinalis TaxID=7719 RepID=UPI00089DD0B2|nr:5-hydroxytryptamine receptor 3A-like [Ciona intestinalis]|eukprot:XP_018672843.1 5-hydroxytryptamine receptor 3A-like [Ciona intestinalis]